MADAAQDDAVVQDFADSDLWLHLRAFSTTLLRNELDGLRKQLKDDMKDMSSELSSLVATKCTQASGRAERLLSHSREGFSRAGTASEFGVGSLSLTPEGHSHFGEVMGNKASEKSVPMGPTRSTPAALDFMSRRVRTYAVAAEIAKHHERIEAIGDVAGNDAYQRRKDYGKKSKSSASMGKKISTRSKGSVNEGEDDDKSRSPNSPSARSGKQSNVRFCDDVGGTDTDEKMMAVNSDDYDIYSSVTGESSKQLIAWHANPPISLPGDIGEQSESAKPDGNMLEGTKGGASPSARGGASPSARGEVHANHGTERFVKPYINPEEDEIRAAYEGADKSIVASRSLVKNKRTDNERPLTKTVSAWTSFTAGGGPTSRLRYRLQLFVRRTEFDAATGMLIVANAVTIGIQTDVAARSDNVVPEHVIFGILDGFFCAAFTLELMLRIIGYGLKFFWMFGWRWNIFDCLVVMLQLLELVVSFIVNIVLDGSASDVPFNLSLFRLFRILRLIRIIRVIRVLRFITDLRTLVYSVFGTFKQFLWTVLLIGLLIYITGVQFTQIVADWKHRLDMNNLDNQRNVEELNKHWGTLSVSILSLFASVSGGVDWQEMVDPMTEHIHPALALLFCAYISFGVFALLNVVTGIFVQSAMVAAKQDNETYVVNQIRELFEHADSDDSGVVSKVQFIGQLHSKEMKEYFKHLDLDIAEADGVFRLLDLNDDGELSADEFLNGSLRLRGTARALEMEVMMRAIQENLGIVRKIQDGTEGIVKKVQLVQHEVEALLSGKSLPSQLPAEKPALEAIAGPSEGLQPGLGNLPEGEPERRESKETISSHDLLKMRSGVRQTSEGESQRRLSKESVSSSELLMMRTGVRHESQGEHQHRGPSPAAGDLLGMRSGARHTSEAENQRKDSKGSVSNLLLMPSGVRHSHSPDGENQRKGSKGSIAGSSNLLLTPSGVRRFSEGDIRTSDDGMRESCSFALGPTAYQAPSACALPGATPLHPASRRENHGEREEPWIERTEAQHGERTMD